jgi:hypothetical protein
MKQSASHPVCRAAKSLPVGIWHPSVMQFYSGPLIHFLSGVDTEAHAPARGVETQPGDRGRYILAGPTAISFGYR